VRALDLTLRLEPSETIWTESSHKFTRAGAEAMLEAAGLRLDGWHTDLGQRFALALAGPAAAAATRAA
jgi:L-histidine N-alpha-methyltransferase